MAEQNYASHRKYVPVYHFVLAVLILINLVWGVINLWTYPGPGSIHGMIGAIALAIIVYLLRAFPLKAQDRLIMLEERLRLATLLPEDLQARASELRPNQLVGIRFASDAEVPDLVRAALDEGLKGEQIKKRIQNWRPDRFRV